MWYRDRATGHVDVRGEVPVLRMPRALDGGVPLARAVKSIRRSCTRLSGSPEHTVSHCKHRTLTHVSCNPASAGSIAAIMQAGCYNMQGSRLLSVGGLA